MPESNVVDTIREAYARYNEGDFDGVLDLLHDDVALVPPPSSPEPEPLHGRDAVRGYLLPNLFDEQAAEPLEILEEGDRILVVAQARARGRESGAEIDQTVFHIFHIEGERASRFEVHMTREDAMAALRRG
jgi:ketosteroid isomerase-like protein